MKIRYGFVSNSSSSSFVFIAPEAAFDKAFEAIKEEPIRKLISTIYKKKKIFGMDMVVTMDSSDAGGYSMWETEKEETCQELTSECDFDDDDIYENLEEILDKFESRIEVLAGKDNYFREYMHLG